MYEKEYNYDKAIEVIKQRYHADGTISYVELEAALGLKHSIGDKENIHSVNSALHRLKAKLQKKYNLTIKSANRARSNGKNWYNIYSLEGIEKATVIPKAEPGDIKHATHALEKDNQRLFLQNEELQKECNELRAACERLAARETEYKNIIQSLMSLAYVV